MFVFSRLGRRLTWDSDWFHAISGPWGNGLLPAGDYSVERARPGITALGFVDPTSNEGWFIPLTPQFETTRRGFGIHPDGNVPGTQGCVGILGDDASRFWYEWNRVHPNLRPRVLRVT
jgi:hypothetical protein